MKPMRTNNLKIRFFNLILIISLAFIPLSPKAQILDPGAGDLLKYIPSKALQIMAPNMAIKLAKKVGEMLEAKNNKLYVRYLLHERQFYQVMGHASWRVGAELPFMGLQAFNLPGIIAYTMSQVMIGEGWLKAKIPGLKNIDTMDYFNRVFPEYLPTLDLKLVGDDMGAHISFYVKDGKLQVQESIWNEKRYHGIIRNVRPGSNPLALEVTIDHARLGFLGSATSIIKVDVSNVNYGNMDKLDPSKVIISETTESKHLGLIMHKSVNPNGRKSIWKKIEPVTTLMYEEGGQSYQTSVAKTLHKLSTIMISGNISWPMYEVGRQFWASGGALSFQPVLMHSWGMFNSFLIGGYFGGALGNRAVDLSVLGAYKLYEKYPNFASFFQNVPVKLGLPVAPKYSCASVANPFLKELSARQGPDVNLDFIRGALTKRYGKRYTGVNFFNTVLFGGFFSCMLPQGYKYVKNEMINLFYPVVEEAKPVDPAPKKSPDEKDKENVLFHISKAKDTKKTVRQIASNVDNTLFRNFRTTMTSILPAFQAGQTRLLEKTAHGFYEANGMKMPALGDDASEVRKHMVDFGEIADQNADELATNLEAQKKLLFLTYMMTAPIKEFQAVNISKISQSRTPKEIENNFKQFMDRIGYGHLASHFITALKQKYENRGSDDFRPYLQFLQEEVIAFIGTSDVIIFTKQLKDQFNSQGAARNDKQISRQITM